MNEPSTTPRSDIGAAIENAETIPSRVHRLDFRQQPPFAFTLAENVDLAPRKVWLIRKYLGAGELSIVYGEPGSAKSAFATDLAFHVACGADWHGKPVSAGSVLYVAAERAALTRRRVAALLARNELTKPHLAIVEDRFDFFADDEHVFRMSATAREVERVTGAPVGLIVIDTMARVIPGADENHSRDIGIFIQRVDKLRAETGSHVMIIHHSGKDKDKRMRGSTALLGAADTTIFVENDHGERSATVDKSNDECDGGPVCFKLESVDLFTDEATGETTTAPVVVASEPHQQPKAKNARSPISQGDKAVLDCLHRAIGEYGVETPAILLLPASVARVVDEKYWRDLVFRHTGAADEAQAARRARFNRGVANLIAKGLVARHEDWVWPIN